MNEHKSTRDARHLVRIWNDIVSEKYEEHNQGNRKCNIYVSKVILLIIKLFYVIVSI